MHQPITNKHHISTDPIDVAMNLSKSGKPAEAIPYFLKVITYKPRSLGAHLGLARCYQAVSQYDKAISIYIGLRQKNLTNIQSEISLARCYQEIDQFEHSLQLLETLAQHNPLNKDISLCKACCLESMGRYKFIIVI